MVVVVVAATTTAAAAVVIVYIAVVAAFAVAVVFKQVHLFWLKCSQTARKFFFRKCNWQERCHVTMSQKKTVQAKNF